MTEVINIRRHGGTLAVAKQEGRYVYIGRPSRWGNPFTWKQGTLAEFVVTKDEVLTEYEAWVRSQPDMMADIKRELRDKVLGCWCKPAACHGDILARIAEEP